MGQEPEAESGDERRSSGGEEQSKWTDSLVTEARLQDSVASRVGRVGDDGEPATSDCTGHQRILRSFGQVRHKGAKVSQGRVVGDGGQAAGSEVEWKLTQTRDSRLEPPTLEATEDDESHQEVADEHSFA